MRGFKTRGKYPPKAVAKVKKKEKLSCFLPNYAVDLFPFFHRMAAVAALCVQYGGNSVPT
jgi:hypothetical protein